MRQKIKRFAFILVVIGLIVGLFVAIDAQVNSSFGNITQAQADSFDEPIGPAGDLWLRHAPGRYDYENEPPHYDVH